MTVHIEKFTEMINKVEENLVLADFHIKLAYKLFYKQSENAANFNDSGFWYLTTIANREIAIIKLSRVYDDDGQSLHLLKILNTIQSNSRGWQLSESLEQKLQQDLEQDKKLISKENEIVKRMFNQRDKEIAHLDRRAINKFQKVAKGELDPLPKYLKENEIQELIERGEKICNKYKKLLNIPRFSISWDEEDWNKIIEKNFG